MITDTLREAVIDAILWSRWHEEDDVRGPEWFAAFKADYDDHHDQAKADADVALAAIEAAGWRIVPADATAEASLATMREALGRVHYLSLVIESAVRNTDPTNRPIVVEALKSVRAALALGGSNAE